GKVLAGDGNGAAGRATAGTQAGHHGRQVHHLEVTAVQGFQAVGSKDVVQVPGEVDVVVGVHRGGGATDVHGAADVRDDQAVLLHGTGQDLGLRGHVVDQRVDCRGVGEAQAAAEGQAVGSLGHADRV